MATNHEVGSSNLSGRANLPGSVPATWVTDYSGGECQESCGFASGAAVSDPRGLRVTDPTGAQKRAEDASKTAASPRLLSANPHSRTRQRLLSMSWNDEFLFPKHALLARVHHVEHPRVILYELLLAHLAVPIRIQRREHFRCAK